MEETRPQPRRRTWGGVATKIADVVVAAMVAAYALIFRSNFAEFENIAGCYD